VDVQCALQQRFGFSEVAAFGQHDAEPLCRVGQQWRIGGHARLYEGVGFARVDFGFGFAEFGLEQLRALRQHGGQLQRPVLLAFQRHGAVEGRAGQGAVAEHALHTGQRGIQLGLGRGLAGQFGVDARQCLLDEFGCGYLAAPGVRMGGTQYGGEERADLPRGLLRLFGAVAVGERHAFGLFGTVAVGDCHAFGVFGAVAIGDDAQREAGDHHEEHQCRRDPGPVPLHEFARAVDAARAHRLYRLAREIARDVLRERIDTGIALCGARRGGARDDRGEFGIAVARWLLFGHAAEQREQGAADAVYIRGCGNCSAVALLGAGVVRREGTREVGRGRRHAVLVVLRRRCVAFVLRQRPGVAVALQQLGDAEIQQHRPSVRIDEDIAGLDVAVDDQALVGEGHRGADVAHQMQDGGGRQRMPRAVVVDRHTVDVVDHEVGLAARRRAAVEQARDVRMSQPGEYLPLTRQVGQRIAARHAAQQLDRGRVVEVAVAAPREEHVAHAAVADAPHQGPRAQHVTGRALVAGDFVEQAGNGPAHVPGGRLFAAEQRAHFGDDVRVFGGETRFALRRRQIGHGDEQRLDARVAVSLQRPVPCASRRA
jgi:hypothetical protein